MKKYELHKVEENEYEYLGTFASKQEAAEYMMDFIEERNEDLDSDDEDYLTPFDFTLEEIESKKINEVVTTYEEAREYLGGKPNADFTAIKNMLSDNGVKLDDVATLVSEVNPKHIKALIAYNRLCTIAQAWNKADGFEPDFNNTNQYKCFPWFEYSSDAAGFVFAMTYNAATSGDAIIGSRLCFMTRERARQFGKQFVDLWNDVFLFR